MDRSSKIKKTVRVKFAQSLSPIVIPYQKRLKERPNLKTKSFKANDVGLIAGCIFGTTNPASVVNQGSITVCKYNVASDAQPTDSISFQGGEQISSISVVPIFYGSAWLNSDPNVNKVMAAIKGLLTTPYLSQMNQYGLSSVNIHQPVLLTNVNPSATHSSDDIGDIVWNLIDDDVFPEPDDAGGRNIYVVFYPQGTRVTDISACGWHSYYSDYDFPFDVDYAWVAAVEFPEGSAGNTPAQKLGNIIRIFSHELLETITDPEPDGDEGWLMNRSLNGGNEIGDACNNTVDFVTGIMAQAYWSEQHKACILPKPRAFVSISANQENISSQIISSGVTHFNKIFCLQGDYKWTKTFLGVTSIFTANFNRNFNNPQYVWTLPQIQFRSTTLVDGFKGTVFLRADTWSYDSNGTANDNKIFLVDIVVNKDTLTVTSKNISNQFKFLLDYSLRASQGAYTATNSGTIEVDNEQFLYEDAYYKALKHCQDIFKMKLEKAYRDLRPPHIGPDDYRPGWVENVSRYNVSGDRLKLIVETAALAAALDTSHPTLAYELRNEVAQLTQIPASVLDSFNRGNNKIR